MTRSAASPYPFMAILGLVLLADGCASDGRPAVPTSHGDRFADRVVRFSPAPGASFGHDQLPLVVLGPPEGGGETQGSTHVASLGCGGEIVLEFLEPILRDGPGPDLLIFENPFRRQTAAGDGQLFVEPGEVAVSEDGEQWSAFPCQISSAEGTATGCAGLSPVLANSNNDLDATDPAAAGGDTFDLATLGLTSARYLRITDQTASLYGPGSIYCQGAAAGFDLDATAGIGPAD